MANVVLPSVYEGMSNEEIVVVVGKMKKTLDWLLNNLDDDNISKITAKSIVTDTLVVGDNIQMGENAIISWDKVNNKPTDLVYESHLANYITTGDLSDELSDYLTKGGFNTLIGQDYIVTGKILANQIAVGTLTGFNIRTDISGKNRIEFKSDGFRSFGADDRETGISIKTSDYSWSQISLMADGVAAGVLLHDGMGNIALRAFGGRTLLLDAATIAFDGNVFGLKVKLG